MLLFDSVYMLVIMDSETLPVKRKTVPVKLWWGYSSKFYNGSITWKEVTDMDKQIIIVGTPRWEDLTDEQKAISAHICYEAFLRHLSK